MDTLEKLKNTKNDYSMKLKGIQVNIEEKINSMSYDDNPNSGKIQTWYFSRFFGKIRSISADEFQSLDREIRDQIEIKRFSETIDGKTNVIEHYRVNLFAKKIKDNHDQINEILQILMDFNDPLLYDLILKKISMKCYKQYNNISVYSSNKIFQSSEKFFHFFYRNYLLLAILNQAPNDSKAGKFRNNIETLELFGGHINDVSDAYGDVFDLKHLSNYNSLKSLSIHDAGELKSFNMISKFEHLEKLRILGACHKILSPGGFYTTLYVNDLNLDLDFKSLNQLKHLRELTVKRKTYAHDKNINNIHLNTKEKVQEYLSSL